MPTSLTTCPDCRALLNVTAADSLLKCPMCGKTLAAATPEPGWFYAHNKKKLGPVPTAELRRLADAGELRPTDMVLREGERQWRTAGDLPDVFPVVSGPPATATVTPGTIAPAAEERSAAPDHGTDLGTTVPGKEAPA